MIKENISLSAWEFEKKQNNIEICSSFKKNEKTLFSSLRKLSILPDSNSICKSIQSFFENLKKDSTKKLNNPAVAQYYKSYCESLKYISKESWKLDKLTNI